MEDLPPVIDLANEDDLPAVIDLLKRCGLYIPAGTEYMLKQATTLVARKNGQIIGTRSFRPTKSRYYHVFGLCVDPDFRRQGLGEHLCREAERMMYHQGARGYVGEANNEETAQYYVRTLGVRICRLRFAGWRRGLIPYKKVFRQEGFSDSTARRARSCVLYLMRRRYIGKLIEFAARRIEPA